MITKLTNDQSKLLTETYNEWLAIGRRVEPIDRDKASAAIGDMYQAIGKPRPTFLFFSSPMMCMLAYTVLKNLPQLMNQLHSQLWSQLMDQLDSQLDSQLRSQIMSHLRDQLWSQLNSQLRGQLDSQIRDQLGSQLRDQLGSQLRDQLIDQLNSQLRGQLDSQLIDQLDSQLKLQLDSQLMYQLGSQLMDQLGSQLRSQLRSQIRGQLLSQLNSQLRDQLVSQLNSQLRSQLGSQILSQLGSRFAGNQWCSWEVFYDFCNQIGVTYSPTERQTLDLWINQSRNCHWWFPYDGIVLVSDHPRVVNIDATGRLHSQDRLAIEYSDGWGVYALHGVRIPEKYALTKADEINVEEVLKEPSAEVRMAVLGKIGLARALGKIPHKVIDSKNGNDLVEFTVEGEPVRGLVLRWKDKFADKTTVLPVPRTKEEFKESFCDAEYPEDFPDDVDHCEQVRISTFRGFIHQAKQEAKESGKHWMKLIEWQAET